MKTMDRKTLIKALVRMGELAVKSDIKLEMCIYGGAAMMLAYNSRAITKDVDAIVQPSKLAAKLAKQVAKEMQLSENWLNNEVKMFVAPKEQTRLIPWEAPGIVLTAPTAAYLLAMKALACRMPLPGYQGDFDDLRFLIRKLNIRSVDEIQEQIDRYYPDDVMPKSDVAVLQKLIDEVHNES
jgi:hypothetical protein